MNDLSPKEAFLAEWHRVASPVKGDTLKRRQIGFCLADITDGGKEYANLPDTVYLDDLTAPVHRRGFGTQAMKLITNLADRFNVTINLHANPNSTNSPTAEKLREFYARFGFVDASTQDNYWLHKMTRVPQGAPKKDGP